MRAAEDTPLVAAIRCSKAAAAYVARQLPNEYATSWRHADDADYAISALHYD